MTIPTDQSFSELVKINDEVDLEYEQCQSNYLNPVRKNINKTYTIDEMITGRLDIELQDTSPTSETYNSSSVDDYIQSKTNDAESETINQECEVKEEVIKVSCNKNESIGPKATHRFRKAQADVLQLRIAALEEERSEALKDLSEIKKTSSSQIKEINRLQKLLQREKTKTCSLKEEVRQLNETAAELKSDICRLTKDLNISDKRVKAAEREENSQKVKLAKAIEECERHKQLLSKATEATKEAGKKSFQQNDELSIKVRTLERQRNDLTLAFKKQMKLIDLLKRKVVHLEVAKQLDITEEDFQKVIDSRAEEQNTGRLRNKAQI